MDLILFYLSEYLVYTLIMVTILIGAFYARRITHDYEDRKAIAIMVTISFLVLFGGLGVFIKPYFTNTEKYHLRHKGVSYYFRGTGTFINPNDVMTNAHVVDGCDFLVVRAKDGLYEAQIVSYLKRGDGDLAFIRTIANRKAFALISNEEPKIGDILIYPNYTSKPGIFNKIKGKVTSITEGQYGLEFLAPKGRKGNSGSPIYNNKGYLVGNVHSGGGMFFGNYGYASPLKIIKDLAKKHDIKLAKIKNQNTDLTKMDYFFNEYAVGILCGHLEK